MQVTLISRDDTLKQVCQEALASLPAEWRMIAADPDEPFSAGELNIWDWGWHAPLVHLSGGPHQGAHIVVTSREDAGTVLEAFPFPAVTVLLKPVNPETLRCFLEQAASRHQGSGAAKAWPQSSLRKDRDSILDCLLETMLRMQEHDQDRTNFLARAVHDFRTPLTAVTGYSGMLLSGQLGPVNLAQREVLERTLYSTRRLSRLAAALFHWSVGSQVGLQPHAESDIEECCRRAVHEMRPLAGEKSISVEVDLQTPEHALYFDPAQMEQVLVNLLENSCKFTPRGGYIKVRGFSTFLAQREADVPEGSSIERRRDAAYSANAYRMEISDNGMGMRPEHRQTIFQECTPYGGGSDRSGSGLGLAICRRILAEHGGEIFAESGQQGVTFVFVLPFADGEGAAVQRNEGIHMVAEAVGRNET